jgi:hypothetical protein
MEGKIEEDALAIGSLRAQLRYIFMRLEGAAKTNVTTFYGMKLRYESPDPCRLLERLVSDNRVLIGIMNVVVERVCCSVCDVVSRGIRRKVALS